MSKEIIWGVPCCRPRMGGLRQGYLPFFFSKNHRLAREARREAPSEATNSIWWT